MSFLTPLWLALAALAVPIIVLYMLKLRRREVEVSSTLLWQMLLRDRQANAPWQRLKRNLLLFLQLLILAALVFALARPVLPVPAVVSGSVVILLDASASMNAQDVQPTRFKAAQAEAQSVVDNLAAGAQATLILVGRQPQILASAQGDKTELRQAIESAQAGQGPANWEAAFALAAGAAGSHIEQTDIVIISDGGLPQAGLHQAGLPQAVLPPLPGRVHFAPVGQHAENLAISALALRPAGERAELFTRLTNHGENPRQAILSFYVDGNLFSAQQVSLEPGASQNVILPNLSNQPAVYEARLSALEESSQPLDALPLDDAAYAVYRPPRTGRTLLVSAGNLFLEQLLASLPGIQPYRVQPDADGNFELPNETFDLYVLDGVYPPGLPPSSLLIVNPPTNDLFRVTGVFSDTAAMTVADHPLTKDVDWRNVNVLQARRVELPEWATALVRAPAGPLVFAGESSGRRVAAVTFDLRDSDLPLQIAYPILFANLIDYLIQSPVIAAQSGELESGVQPGDSLTIRPRPGVTEVQVISPSGQVTTLHPGESGATFTATDQLGIYRVAYLGAPASEEDFFAVNLFAPEESDIRPMETIQVGPSAVASSAEAEMGQREFWPWLAGLALAVLAVEWWVYHRGQKIPGQWVPRDWLKRLATLARRGT